MAETETNQQAPARRLRHRLKPQEALRRLLRRRGDRGRAVGFRRFPVPELWRPFPGSSRRESPGVSGRTVPDFGADFRFACLKEATLVVLLKYLSSIVRLTLDGVSNVDRGRIDFEASQLIF